MTYKVSWRYSFYDHHSFEVKCRFLTALPPFAVRCRVDQYRDTSDLEEPATCIFRVGVYYRAPTPSHKLTDIYSPIFLSRLWLLWVTELWAQVRRYLNATLPPLPPPLLLRPGTYFKGMSVAQCSIFVTALPSFAMTCNALYALLYVILSYLFFLELFPERSGDTVTQ